MFYQRHLFFCENQRKPGKACCQNHGASDLRSYAKKRLKELELYGPGKSRVSGSGCLGRCQVGPAMVVYPDGVWYRCLSEADVDLIIQQHLINGQVVDELLLDTTI